MDNIKTSRHGIVSRLAEFLAYVASAGIFSLMAMVFVSVIFRYVLNSPILFAEDVMAMLLGITIFTAVPSVTLSRRHISVELFTAPFEQFPKVDRLRRLAVDLVVLFVTFFMSFVIYQQAIRYFERDSTSNTMEWPLYPVTGLFVLLIAIGGCLFAWRIFHDKGNYDNDGGLDL